MIKKKKKKNDDFFNFKEQMQNSSNPLVTINSERCFFIINSIFINIYIYLFIKINFKPY